MQTRSATRANQHAKLLSRLNRHSPKTEFCKDVVTYVKTILEELGPDEVADTNEIITGIRESLPSPRMILTEEFFQAPMFPIAILKDVLSFYLANPMTDEFLTDLELPMKDKANPNLMCYVWFAALLCLDKGETYNVIEQVRFNRGSANPLRKGSPSVAAQSQIGNPATAAAHAAAAAVPLFSPDTPAGAPSPSIDIAPVHAPPVAPPIGSISSLFPAPVPVNDSTPAAVLVPTHNSITDAPDPIPLVPHRPQNNHDDLAKKALNVQQYFKDDRFSGEIHESIDDKIQDYLVCSMQLRLDPTQKATFFVNVFKGNARRFFLSNVKPGMSFEQLEATMRQEYDSPARQIQVQSELESLEFRRFMSSKDITEESAGLKQLVDHINDLSPQCPMEFRSEPQKIRFLRNAVVDLEWAHQPVSQCTSAKYSFNEFATALREALQLHLEKQRRSGRPSGTHLIEAMFDPMSDTFYGEYGRHPKHVKPRSRPVAHGSRQPSRKNKVGKDGKRLTCFRCGSDSHFQTSGKCEPGAILAHARKRLNNGSKAVHLLSELISGMEGEIANDGADPGVATSEADAFDSFFVDDDSVPQDEDEDDEVMFTNFIRSHFVNKTHAQTEEEATEDFRIGGGKL